ncbi:MAG: hypothetical protein LBJ10_08125 [Clostridiales bacterium]|jgi:hypothetical protein|nr:hypothetical protein [Clostridiales bacterium]
MPYESRDSAYAAALDAIIANGWLVHDGGPGSGNFGHAGRPGEIGGSGSMGGGNSAGGSSYENAVDKRVLSFIGEVAAKGSKGVAPLKVGSINKEHADKLHELTGANYEGYSVMLTADAVRHIESRHGENGKADKSMSDVRDIARIGYAINNFDSAELTGEKSWNYRNSDNSPSKIVLLRKRVNGNYYVAEAAPDTKKKSVYIVSAYKSKAPAGAQWN